MYDMYPDWGPARNNPDDPRNHRALQASLEQWATDDERPDDN